MPTSLQKKFQELRILIIEDQTEARGILKSMLQEIGVTQVLASSDGLTGLQFIDKGYDMVDLIICDWNMPHMSGIQLLRQLRATGLGIPFLMVTGRADFESVKEAKNSGVTGYIRKPFSLRELEEKLMKIMSIS